MKNVSIVAKAVGVALVIAVSAPVMAESKPATASVTVKNTFELTIAKPLTFGEIRVTADPAGTEQALVTVFSDVSKAPTVTSLTDATMQILTPGEPGEVTVAGVAAFSNLTITLPAGPFPVAMAQMAPNTPAFTLSGIEAFITSGVNANTAYVAVTNLLTADAGGNASFNFGGILTTSAVATTQPYQDGDYTGTFPIEVIY